MFFFGTRDPFEGTEVPFVNFFVQKHRPESDRRPLYLKWGIPTFFSFGDEEVI